MYLFQLLLISCVCAKLKLFCSVCRRRRKSRSASRSPKKSPKRKNSPSPSPRRLSDVFNTFWLHRMCILSFSWMIFFFFKGEVNIHPLLILFWTCHFPSCSDTKKRRRGRRKGTGTGTGTVGAIKSAAVKNGSAPAARKRRVKTKKGNVTGNQTQRKMLRLVCCGFRPCEHHSSNVSQSEGVCTFFTFFSRCLMHLLPFPDHQRLRWGRARIRQREGARRQEGLGRFCFVSSVSRR